MNSGIGDFARCLVGGVRRDTRKLRKRQIANAIYAESIRIRA